MYSPQFADDVAMGRVIPLFRRFHAKSGQSIVAPTSTSGAPHPSEGSKLFLHL
jgi:hypothetical protein